MTIAKFTSLCLLLTAAVALVVTQDFALEKCIGDGNSLQTCAILTK